MYCNKKGYFGDTLKQRFLLGEETEAQKDKVNLSKVTNNHRACTANSDSTILTIQHVYHLATTGVIF